VGGGGKALRELQAQVVRGIWEKKKRGEKTPLTTGASARECQKGAQEYGE